MAKKTYADLLSLDALSPVYDPSKPDKTTDELAYYAGMPGYEIPDTQTQTPPNISTDPAQAPFVDIGGQLAAADFKQRAKLVEPLRNWKPGDEEDQIRPRKLIDILNDIRQRIGSQIGIVGGVLFYHEKSDKPATGGEAGNKVVPTSETTSDDVSSPAISPPLDQTGGNGSPFDCFKTTPPAEPDLPEFKWPTSTTTPGDLEAPKPVVDIIGQGEGLVNPPAPTAESVDASESNSSVGKVYHGIHSIKTTDELFSILQETQGIVDWRTGGGLVTKGELLAGLRKSEKATTTTQLLRIILIIRGSKDSTTPVNSRRLPAITFAISRNFSTGLTRKKKRTEI